MIDKRVVWKESIGQPAQVFGTIVDLRITRFGVIFDIEWDNGGHYSYGSGHCGYLGKSWSAEELELVGEEVL